MVGRHRVRQPRHAAPPLHRRHRRGRGALPSSQGGREDVRRAGRAARRRRTEERDARPGGQAAVQQHRDRRRRRRRRRPPAQRRHLQAADRHDPETQAAGPARHAGPVW